MLDASIFTVPAGRVDRLLVSSFLDQQATERLFLESTTVEFKREISGGNVVKAICAMANADGGIVFVGVDEKNPSKRLGVPLSAQDVLVNQCRTLLQPSFFPEVIPVPTDSADRVILVVRIDREAALQPVFCGGSVYVRVPGNSVPANRDQVLSMARSPASSGHLLPGAAAFALSSAYYPEPSTGAADQPPLPDLRLRGAGGVALRPELAGRPLLTTALRKHLQAVVDDSNLVRWATGPDPHNATPWGAEITRSDRWRVRRQLPRRWAPRSVSIAIEARQEDLRLTWSVDVDLAHDVEETSDAPLRRDPVMAAEDMIRGWLELGRLVGQSLPNMATDHLASPPVGQPEAMLWAMGVGHDLGRLLALDRLPHDLQERPLADGQLLLDGSKVADLETNLLIWLQRTLLDDGVTNGDVVGRELMIRALDRPVDFPWL